ncbi:MAG: 4Fe-4S dicluster domain-containing protein [bacterium JZ-2024 1]
MPVIKEDDLERMQRDLERALKKPIKQRSWVMLIDTRKCSGCRSCVVACISENALPPGVNYRRVSEVENGTYPEVAKVFMPFNCYHCDDPPCAKAAPKGAIQKRPDGIVILDYSRFSSREEVKKVIDSCPYGAISEDTLHFWSEGTPERAPYDGKKPSYEYGKKTLGRARVPRKCHFCVHRVDQGMLPACVVNCICGATLFGDIQDPDSLVSELMAKNITYQKDEGLPTHPRVYYLAESFDVETNLKACALCHTGTEVKPYERK